MNTTISNTASFLSPEDIKTIEASFRSGARITVKELATKYGVKVPTMRNALNVAFYGRITFKRGRTGGIHIAG
jgi:hypothetical protein